MAEPYLISQEVIDSFAQKLGEWARTLDERQEAMLVDLLAKAGGDVFGHTIADTISDENHQMSSSELSPLELRDFSNAVVGIFAADQPLGD